MAIIYCDSYKKPPFELKDSTITFGVFDGIHDGHKYIITRCVEDANKHKTTSNIVTFDIDPDELFVDNFIKLMTNEERISALQNTGVDNIIVLNFKDDIKDCNAKDFLHDFFGKNTPKSIHVGNDLVFGKQKTGNVKMLSEWGSKHGMCVVAHELLEKDGKAVTSTSIRNKIREARK